jgi:translocation and assembly module TamB
MRRKILIGALSLLGVILILVIAAFWYVRSGRLDLKLQSLIVEALEEAGITAKIGSTHLDLRGYKVTLKGIELYPGDGTKPFGKVESLEVTFSVIDYFRQKINITDVVVNQPEVWIEVDEEGRSNIEAIQAKEEKEPEKESAINFFTADVQINQGKVNLLDRRNNLSAVLPDLMVKFSPHESAALVNKINHSLTLDFSNAVVEYQGQKIEPVKSRLEADLKAETPNQMSAQVAKFELDSPPGNLRAQGQVPSFKPFKYDFSVRADAALAEVARVFAPDLRLDGEAVFIGKVEGTGADYKVNGSVESGALTAEGFRVSNVKVDTNVSGSGAEYTATADLSSGGVSGPDISTGSIRLSNATVKGRDADFDVTGQLALDSLKSGRVTLSGLRGQLSADPDRVSLAGLSASTLGGTVTGSASVAYGGGTSNVDIQFSSIDLDQASTLAAAKEVEVTGTANGTARLAFPGLNYKSATGRIDAKFDARISPPQSSTEPSPAKGEIALTATGRGFNIERAVVESAASQVTATGSVGWNGAADLAVDFKSSDMAEVQRVIDAFGLIPEEVKEQYGVALSGEGRFAGRVEGRLASPSVRGRVSLASIKTNEDVFGSFEGDVAYSASLLSIENAALVRPDGSRADFSLTAPLEEENRIALKANVQNFDLASIVRAAVPSFSDFIGRGVVNGTVDLRGLPGSRTIEGTADLSLNAAEFNVPASEDGEESKSISVPEFTGNVKIANSVLTVENLRMQVGESQIAGQGMFNLDTYAYSLNAEGKNVDLNQVARAATDSVQLAGLADVTVTGQGVWEDWSDINLNATIQGHDVTFNGRDLGDAKLVAYTENGLLKVEATGNVLDQPRTIAGTIDLRDRKNYPVSATVEFADTDLGPYLGLVAPQLSSVSGRATGTIRLSGPLQEPDQIQAVAEISKLELGGPIAGGQQYTITNQGNIRIVASPQLVTIEPVTFTGESTRITFEGTLGRESSANTSLKVNGEIDLRFVSSFAQTVFATGIAEVQASIVGSLDSPQLLGFVNLKDVGVRVVNVPLSIARGNGQVRFTADQALIENFQAVTPGGGSIIISGGAALSGLVPDRFRLEAAADQVSVEFPRDTQSVFDAQVVLQGNRRVQVLSGNLDVRRASYLKDITIDELIASGGPFGPEFVDIGPGGGSGQGPAIGLDLRVNADNTLIVRNNLADAIGSAFLNIRGPISDPTISGRVLLSQGTLQFRNDRYELVRGLITFPGKRRADPILDILAESDISGYRLTVGFSGTLAKLETTLRSDPELPEVDIVSLILTGTVAGDRSTAAVATQSGLGLAQSILSASLSEQIEKGTRRLFGLSRFSIDPLIVGRGDDPTARVTLGQRLTKNLTVTYSQNLTSSSSGLDRIVLVEYRISNRFSVVGYRNERSELGFDVRVRKRF